MLKRLYIGNFALVDELEISFESGMNVLTGETGAGKSIIVGAISRLLGEKVDKNDIRSGAKLAVIEGDFEITGLPEIEKKLNDFEIEYEDDKITLRKEIISNRASRSFINGQMVALAQLREITEHLAELFGQHSHQQLLDEKNHQAFLDRFASLTDNTRDLQDLYHEWQSIRQELARFESRKETERNERELLLFQKDEIGRAKIRVGEEEELLAERKILDASQLLGEKSSIVLNMLDQDDGSALGILGLCRKEFSSMTAFDKSLEKNLELLEQSIINLEEFRSEIESYISSIPDDPERQERINLRLDEIYRLKKKSGGSEESILAALRKINRQLSQKIDVDERIEILRKEERLLLEKYTSLALEISAARKKASQTLSKLVEKELRQLGIDSARFRYDFIYESDPDGIELEGRKVKPAPQGLETGRFLVSANPGEPLKPLAKTASGGEISRIMLALKAADKPQNRKHKALLVFDEIDAGIGGEAANVVAKRLSGLSDDFQVLVITHLHQIAAVSDHHLAVEKVDSKSQRERKTVTVKRLNQAEKKKEIRRMISFPEEAKVR